MRPTVIVNVPDSSASMQEEIFGPVVCVSSFDTEEEVTMMIMFSSGATQILVLYTCMTRSF